MDGEKDVWVWIVAIIVLLFVLGSFGMGGYGLIGFGMGFGFVFMLLFLGFLIWLIVMLFNTVQSNKKEGDDPLTMLKKRYASGEISKEQYEEMKKELK